jgi:hypothetical protein
LRAPSVGPIVETGFTPLPPLPDDDLPLNRRYFLL